MKKVDMELEIPENLPNDNDDKVSIQNLFDSHPSIFWQEQMPIKGEQRPSSHALVFNIKFKKRNT